MYRGIPRRCSLGGQVLCTGIASKLVMEGVGGGLGDADGELGRGWKKGS